MTNTVRTAAEIRINRPPAEVWDIVADYATDTRWRKGIIEMTPDVNGPPTVGVNVHEVLQLGGRAYTTDSTVTAIGPGYGYRFAGIGTSGAVRGGRRVVAGPEPGTAVFTFDVEVEPTEVPLFARPVLGWWLRRSLNRDLRCLRDLIEAAA